MLIIYPLLKKRENENERLKEKVVKLEGRVSKWESEH